MPSIFFDPPPQNPAPPRMMIIADYRIICRVLTIPGGAGFFPSTVSLWKQHSWVSQSAHSSSTGKACEVQGMWGGWRMLPSGLKMVMNPEMIWNAYGNICCNYKTTKKWRKWCWPFFFWECCGDHQPKLRNICVFRNAYRGFDFVRFHPICADARRA